MLAECDMVLGISENTINYQFEQLWKRKKIQREWNILIDSNEVLINPDSKTFDDKIDNEQFDVAFKAKIEAPTIKILKNDSKVLNFFITFKSGTMYSWEGNGKNAKVKTSSMENWIYAFKVAIGNIEKDANNVSWITDESKEYFFVISKFVGLPVELFSIESIFLDFENSNYSDYSTKDSKIDLSITELAYFQSLLSNAFKHIKNSDNPYILGYGLKLKKYENQEKALFQPTTLRHTTTYDDNPNLSSFNFLMMIDNKKFPDGQAVGVLNKTIIKSESNEISGALALNNTVVTEKLFLPLIEIMEQTIVDIDKKFKSAKFNKNGNNSWVLNSSYTEREEKKRLESKYGQKYDWPGYNSKKSLEINFSVSNHQDLGGIKLDYSAIVNATIDYDEDINFGKHVEEESEAILSVLFTMSKDGKIETKVLKETDVEESKEAYALYPTNMPIYDLSSLFTTLKEIGNNIKSSLEDKISNFSIGKIIFPLGDILMYKNMEFEFDEKSNSGALVLDAAYYQSTK